MRSTYLQWTCALVLAISCRGFESKRPSFHGTGGSFEGGEGGGGSNSGTGVATGGTGAVAGSTFTGGQSTGGSSGAIGGKGGAGKSGKGTGGAAAVGGGSPAGEGPGGDGGEAGTAGAGPTPMPGILGAVRVFLDGVPKCGGTLITNSWVITADQCVSNTDGGVLRVSYGLDSENPEQARGVTEVLRYPGNNGTFEARGRDVLLLGVAQPFRIDGRTDGYFRPVYPTGGDVIFGPARCVGWDLRVDTRSPTTLLHEEDLTASFFEPNASNGVHSAGSRVWWVNTSLDPNAGVLHMPDDVGTGCYLPTGFNTFLTTIHTGNPTERRKGGVNDGREAYSQSLGDSEILTWIEESLFDAAHEQIAFEGQAGACAPRAGQLVVFGLDARGKMTAWSRSDAQWTQIVALEPPALGALSRDRPAALCFGTGDIQLLAADVDGGVWRQQFSAGGWRLEWEKVGDAFTPVTSGLAVVGDAPNHFHLFARGGNGELRHAEFDRQWTGIWDDFGGTLLGPPTARLAPGGRLDVYARSTDDSVWQLIRLNEVWWDWFSLNATTTSAPAVASWASHEVDVFFRAPFTGIVRRVPWHGVGYPILETGIVMPEADPVAVADVPGHFDLFASEGIEGAGSGSTKRLWHAWWPRAPR